MTSVLGSDPWCLTPPVSGTRLFTSPCETKAVSDTLRVSDTRTPLLHRQHLSEVLVATAAEPDEDQLRVELPGARERVRRLERGDDPLGAGEVAERLERLRVVCPHILRSADVPKVRVLRADARIVEAGRDRVRVGDLPVLVGEDRRAGTVQHAGPPAAERRRTCC